MMTNSDLLDLHLLYCNKGRKEKVVLGLTDTMYKKRIQTAGRVDRMSQDGFKELVSSLPNIMDNPGTRINVDFIFMSNVGPNKEKKFELTFDHFLDALMSLAKARYPQLQPNVAYATLLTQHVHPLYVNIFGESISASSTMLSNDELALLTDVQENRIPDNESVNRRTARLVLTPEGTMPLSAINYTNGPAVQMSVAEYPSDYSTRFDVKLISNDRSHSNTVSGASSVDGSSNSRGNSSNSNTLQRILAREMVASLALQEEKRQYPDSSSSTIPSSFPSNIMNEEVTTSTTVSAATSTQLETLTNQLSSLIVVLESLRNENIQLKQRVKELESQH